MVDRESMIIGVWLSNGVRMGNDIWWVVAIGYVLRYGSRIYTGLSVLDRFLGYLSTLLLVHQFIINNGMRIGQPGVSKCFILYKPARVLDNGIILSMLLVLVPGSDYHVL
jgi:hypothetical protein